MGMSIDEARTALVKERKYALHENKQAFDIAIDTMRKYQKIEQIIQEWRDSGLGRGQLYEIINGVLQDEKID